jgi:hypothetical protein
MNLPKYLVEYMGTLLIATAMIYTHHNPILVSVAFLTALYIGKGVTDGYYSPLAVMAMYGIGQMDVETALKNIGAQLLAVLSLVVTYSPVYVHSA